MFSWLKSLPMEAEARRRTIKKVTVTGAIVNCLLATSQILFGVIGHSQALLADGFHTLSDLLSDFIVLFAVKQSSQKADAEHPYGHGRIETMADDSHRGEIEQMVEAADSMDTIGKVNVYFLRQD